MSDKEEYEEYPKSEKGTMVIDKMKSSRDILNKEDKDN